MASCKRLVGQCLGRILIARNDATSLEPVPVNGTNDKEDHQREFEERYVINEGDVGQSWEGYAQHCIGKDAAQSSKP